MSELLLDKRSRQILAGWLLGKDRPPAISLERWRQFKECESSYITFAEMADLCDHHGPVILDLLTWKRAEGKGGDAIESLPIGTTRTRAIGG